MMHEPIYPEAAGHRGIDTSIAAAETIGPQLGYLQKVVRRAIIEAGANGASTNEIAERLQVERGSVQPRTSELRAKGLIVDSGRRRRNANGKLAIVWIDPNHLQLRKELDHG